MSRSSFILICLSLVAALMLTAVALKPGLVRRAVSRGNSSMGKEPCGTVVELVDYLPARHVTDGSVDYTVAVQAAIDSAAGRTLRLPPFPILVAPRNGEPWCLLVRTPIAIEGSPGSVLRETTGAVQLLRCEAAEGVALSDFTLIGHGGVGRGLGHGTLQITGGGDIRLEGLSVLDADADGIAVANASDVRVVGCRIVRASKAGIYVTNCSRTVVSGNVVSDTIGHLTASNRLVGASIQLLSNSDLVCASNVVENGVGAGILCGANTKLGKPHGNMIEGNRISGCRNPSNSRMSSGILCENSSGDTATQTLIAHNSIQGCGDYGLYIENHDGSAIIGNSIVESERSGIVVGSIASVLISDNMVLNSNTSGSSAQAGIYLLGRAKGVVVSDNDIRASGVFQASHAAYTLLDASGSAVVRGGPRIESADQHPASGSWSQGDRVYSLQPVAGGYLGWVCTRSGRPGAWRPFGKIE